MSSLAPPSLRRTSGPPLRASSIASNVLGCTMTGPSGSVPTTWNARWPLPNSAVRTRSPLRIASPSIRRAMYSISSSRSGPEPTGFMTPRRAMEWAIFATVVFFSQLQPGVGRRHAIELDQLFSSLLFECGHRLGDGPATPTNLQHVARHRADLFQGLGVQANDAAADILAPGLNHRQVQR